MLSADVARRQIGRLIDAFLQRTRAWHRSPESARPAAEHAALAAALGLGKSSIVREALGPFIAELYAAGLPHRVLYLVPQHRLSAEAETLMRALGLRVAVWRGREAEDPAVPGSKMCRNPDAVRAALNAGAPPEPRPAAMRGLACSVHAL